MIKTVIFEQNIKVLSNRYIKYIRNICYLAARETWRTKVRKNQNIISESKLAFRFGLPINMDYLHNLNIHCGHFGFLLNPLFFSLLVYTFQNESSLINGGQTFKFTSFWLSAWDSANPALIGFNFIHFSEYKLKIKLILRLIKIGDQALFSISISFQLGNICSIICMCSFWCPDFYFRLSNSNLIFQVGKQDLLVHKQILIL